MASHGPQESGLGTTQQPSPGEASMQAMGILRHSTPEVVTAPTGTSGSQRSNAIQTILRAPEALEQLVQQLGGTITWSGNPGSVTSNVIDTSDTTEASIAATATRVMEGFRRIRQNVHTARRFSEELANSIPGTSGGRRRTRSVGASSGSTRAPKRKRGSQNSFFCTRITCLVTPGKSHIRDLNLTWLKQHGGGI